MLDTQERPDITEQYEVATQASSLLVESHRRGAADVLIAAGWSQSRVGMALLRLHSEWDGAAKPKRVSEAGIKAIAERMKTDDARAKQTADRKGEVYANPGAVMPRARSEAALWYARELRLLASSLKGRATVLEQLHLWAMSKGVRSEAIGPALFHWLHATCPVCDGHGFRKVPDQPALSAKRCHHCSGSGKSPRPEGAARVQNFLDDCCQKARTSLKARLHGRHG